MILRAAPALGFALAVGCATPHRAEPAEAAAASAPLRIATDAAIPVFASDDPRVATAGFVRHTLRLHSERDGVRYTLMAFVVGDRLSLGAMVKGGTFAGTVTWRLGARALTAAFDAARPQDAHAARADGNAAAPIPASGASAMGTAWVMVELPLADWLATGTALQLTFAPTAGQPVALPAADAGYRAVLAPAGA